MYFKKTGRSMIYKHIKGGIYDSETRWLNACLLTQYYFMSYIANKIIFMCKNS